MKLGNLNEFLENPTAPFCIYGAGDFGRETVSKIYNTYGLLPEFFIDRKAEGKSFDYTALERPVKVIGLDEFTKKKLNIPILFGIYFLTDFFFNALDFLYEKTADLSETLYVMPPFDIREFSQDGINNTPVSKEYIRFFEKELEDKCADDPQFEKDFKLFLSFSEPKSDNKKGSERNAFRDVLSVQNCESKKQILYIFGASQMIEASENYPSLPSVLMNKLSGFDIDFCVNVRFGAQIISLYNDIKNINIKPNDIILLAITPSFLHFDIDIMKAYLIEIRNFLAAKKARFLFFVLPTANFKKQLTSFEKFRMQKYEASLADKFNDRLIAFAVSNGIACFTVPARFYDDPNFCFSDYNHVLPDKTPAVAEFIADILIKSEWLNVPDFEGETAVRVFNHHKKWLSDLLSSKLVGIDAYCETLSQKAVIDKTNGCIVMNCNPPTNGHLFLIETAARKVDNLYIFVVEENRSVFPFEDRFKLVTKICEHLSNVTVLPSGKFVISSLTFPEYFIKGELRPDEKPSVILDLQAFAIKIAPSLLITKRFAGEEPFDFVTKHYNDEMRKILPFYGIEFAEIPRREMSGKAISATSVRKLLDEKNFDKVKELVPAVTFEYLSERFGV